MGLMVTEKRSYGGGGRLPFGVGLLLALTAVGGLARIAMAQPAKGATDAAEAAGQPQQSYEQLPVDDNLKHNITTINQILISGRFGAGQQAIFTNYYEKFALARWTVPANIARLPSYRRELRNSLMRRGAGAGPDVHDFLAGLILDFMNKLIAGHYHPVVQINAMLMIGELNSVESPPTPLPAALDALIAAAGNPKLPPAVRVAAMVGIQRHAMLRPDAEVRRTISSAALKLASDGASSGNVGRQWLLAQAIETLADMGSLGENNAAFKVIVKTLSDGELSLSTRGIAANALGRLNYEGATGIKPADAAAAVGQFLVDACSENLRQAKNSQTENLQRKMKQQLAAAATALDGENDSGKGLASAARETAQRNFVGKLQEEVKAASKVFEDPAHAPADIEGAITDLRSKLESWTKTKP